MTTLRDALLSNLTPDAVIDIKDVEGNSRKLDKMYEEIRNLLAARYTVVADKVGNRIYVQYKR